MSLTGNFDKQSRRKTGRIANPLQDASGSDSANYVTPGHIRNLCFVWPDGKRKAITYALITDIDFDPAENTIMIEYNNAQKIMLKGRNLDKLFEDLFFQITRQIMMVEKRYDVKNEGEVVVNVISIGVK